MGAYRWFTPSLKATMTTPLRVVAVSGGIQRPSKSAALAAHLLDLIADEVPSQQTVVEMAALAPQLAGAVWRSQLPSAVEQALLAVEQADVLVVATPVFRGSYTGLFKHFFDFIDQDALIDKPVLLAATGGSERHALVIDHQLRPLFSFFQARSLPLGVYATDKDFVDHRLHNPDLLARARLAVQRAKPLLALATPAPTLAVPAFTQA
ncbi:FMN reductase [Comamonas sp. JUb58]|nr:FMN reductase [Comamonas sp. JUb58]